MMMTNRNALIASLTVVMVGALLSVAVLFGIPAMQDARASAPLTAPTSSEAKAASVPSVEPAAEVVDAQVKEKETRQATELLGKLAKKYRHLDDVTVSMGTTPDNKEAVAYYTDGEILISSSHTVSIEKILAHEVWHVIDWRDNGRLDWGEDLPPVNSSDYLSQ
ncbi:MAG TPA: hypothetical protein VLA05_12005 [Coriobacteriia bacterium]|nr:hypothetical protein [Coriobacteriia bacterium]